MVVVQLLLLLILMMVMLVEIGMVEEECDMFELFGFDFVVLLLMMFVICVVLVLLKDIDLQLFVCVVFVDLYVFGGLWVFIECQYELFGMFVCYYVVCVNWCLMFDEMNVLFCQMEVIECVDQCNYGWLIWYQFMLNDFDCFFMCG